MISVIIPSRLDKNKNGKLFVERAIETVLAQGRTDCQIIVGVDPGQATTLRGAEVVEGPRANLSAVINAAAERIEGEYLAFLEDDDEWSINHLAASIAVLDIADFVSGTQLEVDEDGIVQFINDFPTVATWVMKRSVWDAVGGFDESYAVHQEHDWLGRLTDAGISRGHLVEATAPTELALAEKIRPWLSILIQPGMKIARHSSPWPLVTRLRRSTSWMGQIRDGSAKAVSDDCTARIVEKYGRFPW